jgi:hypothetical protein
MGTTDHVLVETDTYRLVCYSGGRAYSLLHKILGKSIFVEGESARGFEDRLDDLGSFENYELNDLWDLYYTE